MIVIQIRGTSGSGKSHAMYSSMQRIGRWEGVYIPNRKRPIYHRTVGVSPKACLLGTYDQAWVGCDSIRGGASAYYSLIQKIDIEESPGIILAEGLMLSEDVKWTSKLLGAKILFLTTPIEKCLERIRKRRKEAGNDKPLNEANTINRVATIERARLRLLDAGIECRRCSSDQAPDLVMKYLKEFNS